MNSSTKAPAEACEHSVLALTGLGNGRQCYECVKCGAVGLASTEQASAVSPPDFEAYRRRSLGPLATDSEVWLAKHAWDAALAVSPPALAKLRAEVEALPITHRSYGVDRRDVLALIDQHGGALEQQQGHPLDAMLPEICQLLDSVKQEWAQTGSWSEWDQSVRDRITAYRTGLPAP